MQIRAIRLLTPIVRRRSAPVPSLSRVLVTSRIDAKQISIDNPRRDPVER